MFIYKGSLLTLLSEIQWTEPCARHWCAVQRCRYQWYCCAGSEKCQKTSLVVDEPLSTWRFMKDHEQAGSSTYYSLAVYTGGCTLLRHLPSSVRIVLVSGNASFCCSTSRLNGICFVVVLLKTTCSWIPLHGWFSLLQKLGHKVIAVNCYTNAKSIKLSHCCQIHYSLTTLDYPGNPQPSFLGVVNLGLKTFIFIGFGVQRYLI